MDTPIMYRLRTVARSFALSTVIALGSATGAAGQELGVQSAGQSLRPYWHVFIAYAIAIVLVMVWAGSIAKRLRDVEDRLGE
jgi:hypothetical protein